MLAVPLLLVRRTPRQGAPSTSGTLARDLRACEAPVLHVSVLRTGEDEISGVAFVRDDTSMAEVWTSRHVDHVLTAAEYVNWSREQPRPRLL